MSERVRVASVDELEPGAFKVVKALDIELVLYNVGGAYYATSSTCVHQGGPLGDGLFDGATITCPWHAWQFDVSTGEAVFDPGVQLPCYPVHLEGDEILVEV